jgi:nondiscriminating glutamyl-tRNA synthetase
MIRGPLSFELKNFTDFVISRSDGSFNFLFANFADDVEMEITSIIRGEDHMSNGALQGILYQAIGKPIPIFLHLPLILNEDGQKLSKSAQNFNLETLKKNGFLPEAICSYLGSIGSSLEDEAFMISEMIEKYDLSSISSQSVKYEIAKITSINRKFLQRLDSLMILEKLKTTNLNSSFLINNYSDDSLLKIISSCKDSCNTLKDLVEMFDIMLNTLILNDEAISSAKKTYSSQLQLFIDELTKNLKTNLPELIEKHKVSKKDAFTFLRLACTGKQHGLTINQIFDLLSPEEINKRINQLLTSII